MGWDSSRTVPWQRLMREWALYVALMAVILAFLFRDTGLVGALAGLLVSGPLYLLLGYVLAKFGYQRKTLKEMRTSRSKATMASDEESGSSGSTESTARTRPPPTRRTSTGINRPNAKKKRR